MTNRGGRPALHSHASLGLLAQAMRELPEPLPRVVDVYPRSRLRFQLVAASVMLSVGCWIAVAGCSTDAAQDLQTFRTDRCSMSPDLDFGDCCVTHDYLYWKGGTSRARAEADQQFRTCIRERSDWPALSGVYHTFVRLGGHTIWRTPFRWGFGWPGSRPADPLGAGELAQVKARTLEYLTEKCMVCAEGDAESCEMREALADVLSSEIEEACAIERTSVMEPRSGTAD